MIYRRAARRSSGKWHLLVSQLRTSRVRTICGVALHEWQEVDRAEIHPGDLCTNCLRDTP